MDDLTQPAAFYIQDDDGVMIKTTEVMRITAETPLRDDPVDILILTDDGYNLYPFEIIDEDTLEVVKDEELLINIDIVIQELKKDGLLDETEES